MMYLLRWFFPYWKRHYKVMLAVIVFGVISSALRAYMPLLVKNIVNGMEGVGDYAYIKENVKAVMWLGFFTFVTGFIAMTARSFMNIKIETEVRALVFKHILQLDQQFYQKFPTGEIITRLIDDCEEKISWFACSGVFRAFQSLLVFIFAVAVMLKLNWYLTVWALLPMPLLLYIYIKAGHVLTSRFGKLQKSISQIYKILDACFNGMRIIKANSKEAAQAQNFYEKALLQKKREISAVQMQGVFDSMFQYIGFLCTALVFVGGGGLVIDGRVTLGELIAFQFYSAMLVWPVLDISTFFVRGKRALVSVNRINEMLAVVPSVTMPKYPFAANEKIESVKAENIVYEIGGQTVLKGINFNAGAGKKIAFAGKIGSGKSSIAMLLPRLADANEGRLLFNGVDIKDYDFNKLRERIGYVPQQSVLFSTSVKDNILMGRTENDELLSEAVKIAQLEKELPNLNEGLNTVIGVKGATLSGGQKQRVALARALYAKPDVLVLDDCTSAMDAQTENAFWNKLEKLRPGIICFLITHRTKTIAKADHIITLVKGAALEEGTHEELLKLKGLYNQIYTEELLREEYREFAEKL